MCVVSDRFHVEKVREKGENLVLVVVASVIVVVVVVALVVVVVCCCCCRFLFCFVLLCAVFVSDCYFVVSFACE